MMWLVGVVYSIMSVLVICINNVCLLFMIWYILITKYAIYHYTAHTYNGNNHDVKTGQVIVSLGLTSIILYITGW